ncbi:phosphate/phosphite/phosphonate ABC transporter substrate-binding protein [Chitinimonas taiwanensis]|uniref:ABC-type phosphate/phosphonate transport system, substrate-binding protein n=1 Tax=Chitinimonas taiwanensis DSM 18899 TaxID=1121279 RepID=A0A1K2HID6_9NEIS|nr:PhnD/SsuA/transferrin family substrate-binding protein [Chitinimonas taiwanensis]SFZ76461.1 ABC-type phosphate/phosphonate transport system, substrate-binding protein [Chitinimonas taiwanensis DSM 18899]
MEWMHLRGCAVLLAGLLSVTAAADGEPLCMAVAEGSSGQSDLGKVRDKYRPLADEIARSAGRPVKIKVLSFGALLQTIKQGDCELVYTRTSYIAGWAIRDMQYKLLAANEGTKQVVFIAPSGRQYGSVRDLRGLRLAIPEPQSDLTKVAYAMLRDAGVKPEELKLQPTSLQDSIVFGVESQLSDAGLLTSNSKAAKEWEKKGGAWAIKSRPLPNWSFLASPKLAASEANRLQSALLAISQSSVGKKALQDVNLANLVAAKPADYTAIVDWVGPPQGS